MVMYITRDDRLSEVDALKADIKRMMESNDWDERYIILRRIASVARSDNDIALHELALRDVDRVIESFSSIGVEQGKRDGYIPSISLLVAANVHTRPDTLEILAKRSVMYGRHRGLDRDIQVEIVYNKRTPITALNLLADMGFDQYTRDSAYRKLVAKMNDEINRRLSDKLRG